MDRPTIALWREIASLLVVGSLLAATLSPAIILSAAATQPGLASGGTGAEPTGMGPVDAVVAVVSLATQPPATSGASRPPIVFPPVEGPPTPAPRCAAAPVGVWAAPVVSHGPRDTKVVALTFDDGWDPANTLRILGILERSHVNATFFPVGRAVALFPGVWREVAAAGYPIGDHSYDHSRLRGACFDNQLAELARPQTEMARILGVQPFDVMRPPYGAYDWTTRLAAHAAGDLRVVLWDVDTQDWSGLNRYVIAQRGLAGQNGSIVLMHTFVHATAAALPRIIAGYRARGFRFVTIGQLLGLGGPVPFP